MASEEGSGRSETCAQLTAGAAQRRRGGDKLQEIHNPQQPQEVLCAKKVQQRQAGRQAGTCELQSAASLLLGGWSPPGPLMAINHGCMDMKCGAEGGTPPLLPAEGSIAIQARERQGTGETRRPVRRMVWSRRSCASAPRDPIRNNEHKKTSKTSQYH